VLGREPGESEALVSEKMKGAAIVIKVCTTVFHFKKGVGNGAAKWGTFWHGNVYVKSSVTDSTDRGGSVQIKIT